MSKKNDLYNLIRDAKLDAKEEALNLVLDLVDKTDLSALISCIDSIYRDEIKSIVEHIEYDAPFESEDELYEYIWSAVDSNQWVIYTHKIRCVLLCSDNLDAVEEFGLEQPTEQQIAFFAIRQDVYDMIDDTDDYIASDEEE